MSIYEMVKECCNNEGISVRYLEKKLEIGNGTIGKWRNQSPTIKSLSKVADYFDKPVDYFVVK